MYKIILLVNMNGCETQTAVFESKLVKGVILPKGDRESITGYWKILHSEELLLIFKHYLND